MSGCRAGSRNGFCESTIKTTAGPVTVARPKLRGTTEAFASTLFGTSVTKSDELESLVIAGFVRGLSVRDVEDTLADALGAEAALSKSTVSRVCRAIGDEFTQWSARRLDELELDYLFLDASMFKMHAGASAEPVLAAWGIASEGSGVRGLDGERMESTDAWGDFRRAGRPRVAPAVAGHQRRRCRADQRRRDRAAPFTAAALPHSPLSQRACQGAGRGTARAARRVLGTVDAEDLIAAGLQPGPGLVAAVQRRIDAFAEKYGRAYPAAVKCLLTDRDQLTSYLRFRSSTTADPALQLHRTHSGRPAGG